MADIRKIKLPDGNTYDIVPNLTPYIDYAQATSISLTANTWYNVNISKKLEAGKYIAIGYARMTHSGAASRLIELTNTSNQRLSYACSARTSGSGEGTVNFIGYFSIASNTSIRFRIQCGSTGTCTEYLYQIFKIGE